VLPELKKQVETERSQLHRILETHRGLLERCREIQPTADELAALAAILHAFYNGVENIFKRIAVALDGGAPQGEFWHSELIERMATPSKKRPALLSDALNERLQEYLDFRHVFRHAYTFDLKWAKMKHLAVECVAVLQKLEKELETFFIKIEAEEK
jgi:hypothetical protein